MALDLSVYLILNDECTSLFLEDTTGNYSATNTGGYGTQNNCQINDVTGVTVTLTYTQFPTTLVFVFTVANGVITAATLSLATATPVNILSQLVSTVWPFSPDGIELTKDYGVTLPELEDAAYTVDYEITGTNNASPFDYTADDSVLVNCAACCCISKELVDQDINQVNETVLTGAMRADAYLKIADYALSAGNTSKANEFLIKAKELCDCNCGC